MNKHKAYNKAKILNMLVMNDELETPIMIGELQ